MKNKRRERRERKGEEEKNVPDCKNGRKTHTQIAISMFSHRCQNFFSPQEYHQLLIWNNLLVLGPLAGPADRSQRRQSPPGAHFSERQQGAGGNVLRLTGRLRQSQEQGVTSSLNDHSQREPTPLSLAMIGSPSQNGRADRKAEGKHHWQGS